MRLEDIKLFTISNIEGFKIEKHIEMVSSNVVVSIGFFRDIISNLLVTFGGKSRTYTDFVTDLHEMVNFEIRKKALQAGGNCVLGVKVEISEISAWGKNLIKATAQGTAALVNFAPRYENKESDFDSQMISHNDFSLLKQKMQYQEEYIQSSFIPNENFWFYVKSTGDEDFAPAILDKFVSITASPGAYKPRQMRIFYNNIRDYFSLISKKPAIDQLYTLLRYDLEPTSRKAIIKIIADARLADYVLILEFIESESLFLRETGVKLAGCEKQTYTRKDLTAMKELSEAISLRNNHSALKKLETSIKVLEECFLNENRINSLNIDFQ